MELKKLIYTVEDGIAVITMNYLKTEILSREYGKLISNASLIRNRSDYEDFYICSIEDTQKLVRIIKAHGADKILFATDSPWSSQRESIDRLNALPLDEREKRMILGENAARLFGIKVHAL